MSAGERLKRLRDLVDRLERLPASPERDRLLADARGRVVDVDTGEQPGPLRVAEPPAADAPVAPVPRPVPAPPQRRVAAPRPAAADPAPTVPRPADAGDPADWDLLGELSLDDSPSGDPPDDDGPPPWRLGLRG
jgi:hypothetical protein